MDETPEVGGKAEALRDRLCSELLNHGDIGEFFRGELGAPGAADDEEWIAITKGLIRHLGLGINDVTARRAAEAKTVGEPEKVEEAMGDETPTTDALSKQYRDGKVSGVSSMLGMKSFARKLERRLRAAVKRLETIREYEPYLSLGQDLAYYREALEIPQDLRVCAIRKDPLVGNQTCSIVTETMSDSGLLEFLTNEGATTVDEAVKAARDLEETHLEQATNCRWGEDSDPELKEMERWRKERAALESGAESSGQASQQE